MLTSGPGSIQEMLNKQKLVVFLLKLCRWVKLLSVRGDADMPGYKQKVTIQPLFRVGNEFASDRLRQVEADRQRKATGHWTHTPCLEAS